MNRDNQKSSQGTNFWTMQPKMHEHCESPVNVKGNSNPLYKNVRLTKLRPQAQVTGGLEAPALG